MLNAFGADIALPPNYIIQRLLLGFVAKQERKRGSNIFNSNGGGGKERKREREKEREREGKKPKSKTPMTSAGHHRHTKAQRHVRTQTPQ